MLTYDEALQKILDTVAVCPAEERPLLACLGAVLAEDIVATFPLPPFASSSMDGYAVRAVDTVGASADKPIPLKVVEEMATGSVATCSVGPGEAIRIHTGSQIPVGADAVVPIEETRLPSQVGYVEIVAAASAGDCVRPAGEDVPPGSCALAKGTLIRPAEIALAAAVGRATLRIVRPPRVAVIGTGAELVSPGSRALAAGQIYDANSYALAAQAVSAGALLVDRRHAGDDAASIRAALDAAQAADADLIITSGGVSVGEYDLVKQVFAERGSVDFWKVAIRPGKPFAFGHWDDRLFFGLPGNPASSFVTFELFVRPALMQMRGMDDLLRPAVEARLLQPVEHEPGRRSFLRAVTLPEDGGYVTELAGSQGSHLFRPLVEANSLVILPEDVTRAPAGSFVTALLL